MKAMEERIVNFYQDNEKSCTERKKLLKADFQISIDKINAKFNEMPPRIKNSVIECPLSVSFNELQVQTDKLDHEVAGLKESMAAYSLPNSEFVKSTAKPTTDSRKDGGNSAKDRKVEIEHEDNPSANHNYQEENENVQDKKPLKKIIMFIDSNRKHLDPNLLWKNLEIIPCGSTTEMRTKMTKVKLNTYDVVIIHIGVNDIDISDGKTVASKLCKIAADVKIAAPEVKIVLSEVTPRQLTRDSEVISCNKELRNTIRNIPDITIARHSNLRDDKWSCYPKNDNKHISLESIAKLAGNLKAAFRAAIGVAQKRNWTRNRTNNSRYNKNNVRGQREQNGRRNIADLIRQELLRFFPEKQS